MITLGVDEHRGQEGQTAQFYARAMQALDEAGVPFLVGGAFAHWYYTHICRPTKDLDLVVLPSDRDRALAALAALGYHTEVPYPHWLAKAYCGDDFIDIIYNSGNGYSPADAEWFAHAPVARLLGRKVRVCPPEELLHGKAFVMERERYDGADVAHLLLSHGPRLDWPRLLRRFGDRWRVLLSHIVLFGLIYPTERAAVPEWVMRELVGRLRGEAQRAAGAGDEAGRVCYGTILSREQFLVDVKEWGFHDARLPPVGPMSSADVDLWTAAIGQKERGPAEPGKDITSVLTH
ncbi:MAG TPA: nucleotidyltransferase family protein [Polyangiaceae bacterium]|nr:nucleotidyltransferase family protein [Polyangiaceae bacterium]